jgi:hypothetical protein
VGDECWDWRGLAQSMADLSGLASKSPEESGLPLSLWNRWRIWRSVVDGERWLYNDQCMVNYDKGIKV